MNPRVDPTADSAFKRLFGTEGSEALDQCLLNAGLRQQHGGKPATGFRLPSPTSPILREGEKDAHP